MTNYDLKGNVMADKLNYYCETCDIKCDYNHKAVYKHHQVNRVTKRPYKLKRKQK